MASTGWLVLLRLTEEQAAVGRHMIRSPTLATGRLSQRKWDGEISPSVPKSNYFVVIGKRGWESWMVTAFDMEWLLWEAGAVHSH